MPEIVVDNEKLAWGLERGIGKTRTIFSVLPASQRLRMTPCGLVSSAIHAYAVRENIPSCLVLSRPNLHIDPLMEHVVPLLGEFENNPTVVDASPSQFLMYAGISLAYEKETGDVVFPPEKVLSFTLAERQIIVSWLVNAATSFQKVNKRPVGGRFGVQLGEGPLATNSEAIMRATYGRIWDPVNFTAWTSPARVQEDGRVASLSIPKNTISVS